MGGTEIITVASLIIAVVSILTSVLMIAFVYKNAAKKKELDEVRSNSLMNNLFVMQMLPKLQSQQPQISFEKKLYPDVYLTPREIEITQSWVNGKQYSEISEKLHISPNTVKKHIRNIYTKTGCTNKVDLLKFALNHNLIDDLQ